MAAARASPGIPLTTAMVSAVCSEQDQRTWHHPLPRECFTAFRSQPGRQSVTKVAQAFSEEHSLDAVGRASKKLSRRFPQNPESPQVCGPMCRTSQRSGDIQLFDGVVAVLSQAARRFRGHGVVFRELVFRVLYVDSSLGRLTCQ